MLLQQTISRTKKKNRKEEKKKHKNFFGNIERRNCGFKTKGVTFQNALAIAKACLHEYFLHFQHGNRTISVWC